MKSWTTLRFRDRYPSIGTPPSDTASTCAHMHGLPSEELPTNRKILTQWTTWSCFTPRFEFNLGKVLCYGWIKIAGRRGQWRLIPKIGNRDGQKCTRGCCNVAVKLSLEFKKQNLRVAHLRYVPLSFVSGSVT